MILSALAILIALGEWTGLARAIIGRPFYAAVLDVALVGLLGLAVVGAARRRPDAIRLHPLDILVGAFAVLAAIQVLNPNVPSTIVGLEGFRKTAFTIVGYAIVRLAPDRDGSRFLVLFALASLPALAWSIRQSASVLPIELAIIDTSGASPISFHAGAALRAFAPTAGPFHLGILAGSVLLVSLAFAGSRSRSRWWAAVAVIAGIALGASITRANIVASVIAIAVIVLVARPDRLRTAVLAAPAVLATVLSVAIATAVAPVDPGPGGPEPSPPPSGQPGGIPNPLEDRSLQFRFLFWAEQLSAIAERPIQGYGTSAAADGFGDHYAGTGSRNFQPHSLYLKPALELGLGGLVLFLWIIATLLLALRARWSPRDPVWLAGGGVLVMTLVSGLTGPMLDAYPFNLFFWALAGFVVSLPPADQPSRGAV